MRIRFRKKPVVIEAVQWYGKYSSPGEWPDWFNEAMASGVVWVDERSKGRLFIGTLEGTHRAEIGDMIIQGTQGELYPCKPDIFTDIYEKA